MISSMRSSYDAIPSRTYNDEYATSLPHSTSNSSNENETSQTLKQWALHGQRGLSLIGFLTISALLLGVIEFPSFHSGLSLQSLHTNTNVDTMGLTAPDILAEPESTDSTTSHSCSMSTEDAIKALEPTASGMSLLSSV